MKLLTYKQKLKYLTEHIYNKVDVEQSIFDQLEELLSHISYNPTLKVMLLGEENSEFKSYKEFNDFRKKDQTHPKVTLCINHLKGCMMTIFSFLHQFKNTDIHKLEFLHCVVQYVHEEVVNSRVYDYGDDEYLEVDVPISKFSQKQQLELEKGILFDMWFTSEGEYYIEYCRTVRMTGKEVDYLMDKYDISDNIVEWDNKVHTIGLEEE